MDGRWQRRVTAIVAGAGFGKSGLVAEALERNRREPMGHDAWVGCQEEDARLDRIFEAIFTAVRGEIPGEWPADVDDAVNRIADAGWSHAPAPVSILLDDVHLLGVGSPGAGLLAELIRRLPANTDFVLTARSWLPVSISRLISAGEAVVLSEADLAMTSTELRAFADERGRPDLDLNLGDLCRQSIHTATDVDLGSCAAALPAPHREAPAALLAGALAPDPEGWASSRRRLIETSITLASAGASTLEVIALTRLGVLGWQAGDLSVAGHLLPRVERLAGSGDPLAVAVVTLGAAVMAEITGDLDAMWAHLDRFESLEVVEPLRTIGGRFRATADLQYRSPADALHRVVDLEATTYSWLRAELGVVALWACWLGGDERGARRWAERLGAQDHDQVQRLVVDANIALLDAWSHPTIRGRPDRPPTDVGRLMAEGERARTAGLLVPALVLALATATHLVSAGDDAAARTVLVEAFSDPRSDPDLVPTRVRSAVVRAVSLVWVLLPERRAELEEVPFGEALSTALVAARALCRAREAPPGDRSWTADTERTLADPALATRLPALWLVELAARHAGPKPPEARLALARDAVDRLGNAAVPALRHLAASDDRAVAAGAAAILASRAPVSEGHFVLRMLGPMTIERDGAEIDHPDWRRDRVRALFALIARRGTVTRRSAADALWPDLGSEAQANNLRVTLSYLQKVLEPDRTRHELAYHVRGDGASLRFTGRSSWTIDVEEFDLLLDAAEREDRRGASAAALDGYLAAVEWYRGPFLSDVAVEASDEIEQDRLRSRYVRALIRAGDLLVAVGRCEEAQRLAVAAQEADPWSDQAVCLQTECLIALGDRSGALRSHRRAKDLIDELGLPPSVALARIERTLAG